MISKEEAIPVVVGFADGLSDVGLEYLDKATNSENKPVLQKPSTIFNLGVGILGTIASMKFLTGESKIIGSTVFARHVGSGVGAIVNAKLNKQPILEVESANVNVQVEDITPTGGEMEIVPPAPAKKSEGSEGVSF